MKNFRVVFYGKNFSASLGPVSPIQVERYSWNMIGGPDKATLTAPQTADMWELRKYLRCPVEIRGEDGRLNWWGYVNRVVTPRGSMMVGEGLDAMYNYVLADYSNSDTDGTTTDASDAMSIAEYGQKEYRLSVSNATAAQGAQARDMYLAEHKYPHSEIGYSGGRGDVTLECVGWWDSLGWKYYTNAATTDTEDTAQIAAIAIAAGQFLRGAIVENASGITSSPEQDGKSAALSCIVNLLNAGTTNYRPLLATVDPDLYLHIYERSVEPSAPRAVDFLMLADGNLVTPVNLLEPPEHCTCARWVFLKDAPTNLRPFFVESAEYIAAQDKTTFRAAGAYEQRRLDKFVKDGGKPGGGGLPVEPPSESVAISTMPYAYVSGTWISTAYTVLFDNRDCVIYSEEFTGQVATVDTIQVEFQILQRGNYLIGGSVSASGASEGVMNGDVSIYATYGSLVLSGENSNEISWGPSGAGTNAATWARADAGTRIRVQLSAGVAGALILSGNAWIQEVSRY